MATQNYGNPASRNPIKTDAKPGVISVPTQKIPKDGFPVPQGKGTGALKSIPGFSTNTLPGKI